MILRQAPSFHTLILPLWNNSDIKVLGSDSLDHLYSVLTSGTPRFAMDDLVYENSELFPAISPERRLGLMSGILHPRLEQILHQLQCASQFLENLENPVSETDFFSVSIMRLIIENDLFKLSISDTNCQALPLGGVDQCCRVATELYVQTGLAKVNCKVYKPLVTELRHQLEMVDLAFLHKIASNLLLWMLLIGGGASGYNLDRAWFVQNLVTYWHSSSWEEVANRLEGWPWRPKYCWAWRMAWRDSVKARSFIIRPEVTTLTAVSSLE